MEEGLRTRELGVPVDSDNKMRTSSRASVSLLGLIPGSETASGAVVLVWKI
jgi:hypothetical protein